MTIEPSQVKEPVLLVMGLCSQTGRSSQPYRGYILDAAVEVCPIWLFDIPGQNWQNSKVVGKTEFDIFDAELAVQKARELQRERQILGVWSPDEATVRFAAFVAEALRLPGPGSAAVDRARDKATTRQILTGRGLNQPISTTARTMGECAAAAQAMNYPVILKPRNMGASMGVIRVNSSADLPEAFETASNQSYHGIESLDEIVVEEYLEGPEVAVDGYFDGNIYHPMGIAHKYLGFEPYFIEVGHDVVSITDEHSEIIQQIADTHRALCLGPIVSHTEVRTTVRGPVVIEVNPRPGGDFIPMLITEATGVNPIHVAVTAALGKEPDLTPSHDYAASIAFCYVPEDGLVIDVDGSDIGDAKCLTLVDGRTALKLPPRGFIGRYAAVIATGEDVATARAAADAGSARVKVSME